MENKAGNVATVEKPKRAIIIVKYGGKWVSKEFDTDIPVSEFSKCLLDWFDDLPDESFNIVSGN